MKLPILRKQILYGNHKIFPQREACAEQSEANGVVLLFSRTCFAEWGKFKEAGLL